MAVEVSNGIWVTDTTSPRVVSMPAAAAIEACSAVMSTPLSASDTITDTDCRRTVPGAVVSCSVTLLIGLFTVADSLWYFPVPSVGFEVGLVTLPSTPSTPPTVWPVPV